MFSVTVKSGYTPYTSIAYPIEITNNGTTTITIDITSNNSIFTQNNVVIEAGEIKTIYASTHIENETIVFTDNSNNIVNLSVATIEYIPPVEYSNPSYISIFELPGGLGELIPTLDNIKLLLRQGHFFNNDGQVKVWRPDIL